MNVFLPGIRIHQVETLSSTQDLWMIPDNPEKSNNFQSETWCEIVYYLQMYINKPLLVSRQYTTLLTFLINRD